MDWEKYKEIYTDAWKIHKKHFESTDWDSFVEEMQEINKKHNSKFCSDLLIAIAEDLNRKENQNVSTRLQNR